MITREELLDLAADFGLAANVVEKDYSIYVFRCPVCDKTFRRSSYDAMLNPHKDKNGRPCYGRVGHHERTDY